MKAAVQKVFILAENALVGNGLRHRLQERYYGMIEVECFFDFKSCLRAVKDGCDLVIVDAVLDGKKGPEILLSVKLISPDTKGLIYSSNEEVLDSMDSILRYGFAHLNGTPVQSRKTGGKGI